MFHSISVGGLRLIRLTNKKQSKLLQEGYRFICGVQDIKLVQGIDISEFAVVKKVKSRFSEIISGIVDVGVKAIEPGKKFYIKVIKNVKADYVERDIEFASSGVLVEKLSKSSILPARNEEEADTLVLVVVGRTWTYILIKEKT